MIVVAVRWQRFLYLMAGGGTVEVVSPYKADSNDRELVLDWYYATNGTAGRIEGVALIGDVDPPTEPATIVKHRPKGKT